MNITDSLAEFCATVSVDTLPADVVAREVSVKLGQLLGQPVVVENLGGGQGVPAMNAVTRAAADGHTLLMAASGNVTIQPLTTKSSAQAGVSAAPMAP